MVESPVESSGIDPASTDYSRRYLGGFMALVVLSAGIQLLVGFAVDVNVSDALRSQPTVAPTFTGSSQSYSLRPGSTAVWQGQVWVSATPSSMPGAWPAGRNSPSSRLLTIDLTTGTVKDTGLVLSPAPVGMLVVDNILYAVTPSVVYRIDGSQAIPRSPRRSLNRPTAPFVYEGRLAVLERSRDGEHLLLTWNEGEWEVMGQTQLPGTISESVLGAPDYSEVSVVIAEGKSFVFFSNWAATHQREGLVIEPVQDAVSALHPVNRRPVYDDRTVSQPLSPRMLQGWRGMPSGFSTQVPSQEMLIKEDLWAACVPATNTGLLLYKFEDGGWVLKIMPAGLVLTSFSVVTGPTNYLVTDNLRLFVFDDPVNPRLIGQAAAVAVRRLQSRVLIGWLSRYVLAAAVLALGASWLMRKYRSPQYVYGHRHATHASILRRGVARMIDTVMLVYPAYLGFTRALSLDSRTLAATSERVSDAIVLAVLATFGIWSLSIFAVSVIEGCWGVTPGKWLCGIRTLRTTLRPCGVVRALARELLVYLDSVFLLAWQPGMILIGLTKHWQRLGDLAADTVVVRNPDRTKWNS